MAADAFGAESRCSIPGERHQAEDRELEARLDRLLADPTVRLLMERDGLEREVLLGTIKVVRRRIAEAKSASTGASTSAAE